MTATGMMQGFRALVPGYGAMDDYGIVGQAGHVLWESARFPHCSSRDTWDAFQDGCRKADSVQSEAFRSAALRLYSYLRNHNIPLRDAALSEPVLRTMSDGGPSPFLRGRHHLHAYLRMDYEADRACVLEFAEGGSLPLQPGELTVVSGFRRVRTNGWAWLLSVGIDLPAVARMETLATPALLQENVHDGVVFCAATATPLSLPLPPPQILNPKLEWLNARFRKRYRHQECPAVRRFLMEGADPRTAVAEDIERIRRHGLAPLAEGPGCLAHSIPVLDGEQCSTLRKLTDVRVTSVTADSVDDEPEYQVNLTLEELAAKIGGAAVDSLLRLPERVGAAREGAGQIDCILRIYSSETRPYISFHSDTCRYTVNVSLSPDEAFCGGDLLALVEGKLETIPRQCGSAVVHAGRLVHGVSRIQTGTRHSLILFFT